MAATPKPNHLLTFIFFLILCGCSYARLIPDPPDLLSDGLSSSKAPHFLHLLAADEACEQSYGFLPCTTTGIGNLMFLAATYLFAGSELLLEILGPGIVGGFFLPMLGALPDALLILVSGLSGSTETAQSI